MLFRLVAIRKHKNIVFCDSFNQNFERIQLAIPIKIFENNNITVGSVIDANYELSKNKYGNELFLIKRIDGIINHNKIISYKSINTELESVHDMSFVNSMNGGINLKYWEIRQRLIQEIRQFLIGKSFIEVNTRPLMNYRGTSIVSPMEVVSKYNSSNKYLKLTHELELKKICYITLKSLFEIGYVTRDVYNTKKSSCEYLTLELVSPASDELSAEEFYLKVYNLAIQLAKEYGIQYNEIFNNIEIKDVLKSYLNIHKQFNQDEFLEYYKYLISDIKNIIFINAPVLTPLAAQSEYGIPLETKWSIGPRGIGHGYLDQSNYKTIENAFNEQIKELKEKGIDATIDLDYLKVLEYGGIDTKSLNFGIDRFMYKFLDFENEEQAVRILGV